MAQDDIQGQVVDAQGNPVEGAIVEVTPARRDSSELEENVVRVSTNSNGEYRVWYHPQGNGTTQEWHVSCYNHDGTAYVNSFNNPGVTADLPSNAIPDSEDLHARYAADELTASDGDSISTWPDETGNGFDLTGGTEPTYIASGINGNPVVRFNGVNQFLQTDWSAISQPNHIFIVFQILTLETGTENNIYDVFDSSNRHVFVQDSVSGGWTLFSGINLRGGTADSDPHIHSHLFNGSNTQLRQDGADVFSGDSGSQSMAGLTLGARFDGGNAVNVDVGEILVYPQNKTTVQTDVESYLSNKWGITA